MRGGRACKGALDCGGPRRGPRRHLGRRCGARRVSGYVSAESDHQAVLGLLEARVSTFGAAPRRQLAGLLRAKSSVEYSNRLVTETEARRLVDAAQRFLEWASKALPS
jgi:hypothetical protein